MDSSIDEVFMSAGNSKEAFTPGDADSRTETGIESGDDKVLEASIDVFRRTGFPIAKTDDTFAVMQFMQLCVQEATQQQKNELREVFDRFSSGLKDHLDAISTATSANMAALKTQSESAEIVGKKLMLTAGVASQRISVASQHFSQTFERIKEEADEAMEQAGQGVISKTKQLALEEVRPLVREEVRIAIASALETELAALNKSINLASKTLHESTETASIRAGKGWLQNVVHDFSLLSPTTRMYLAGGGVVFLLVLMFR